MESQMDGGSFRGIEGSSHCVEKNLQVFSVGLLSVQRARSSTKDAGGSMIGDFLHVSAVTVPNDRIMNHVD